MASQGPNFPTAATGNTTLFVGTPVEPWNNPTNIEAADGSFATVSLLSGDGINADVSADLRGTGFSFSIAAGSTINGIKLEVNYKANVAGDAQEVNAHLLKAGSAVGSDRTTGAFLPTTSTTVSYGGSADLWGTTWSVSDINNSGFGAYTVYSGFGSTVSVDFFRITVTYTPPAGGRTSVSSLFGF